MQDVQYHPAGAVMHLKSDIMLINTEGTMKIFKTLALLAPIFQWHFSPHRLLILCANKEHSLLDLVLNILLLSFPPQVKYRPKEVCCSAQK